MTVIHISTTDLMQFSLEELIRKFKVSPKELRELAAKIERDKANNIEPTEKEKTMKMYYDKIINKVKK